MEPANIVKIKLMSARIWEIWAFISDSSRTLCGSMVSDVGTMPKVADRASEETLRYPVSLHRFTASMYSSDVSRKLIMRFFLLKTAMVKVKRRGQVRPCWFGFALPFLVYENSATVSTRGKLSCDSNHGRWQVV